MTTLAPITDTDTLANTLTPLNDHPFVTIDTEFLRETTYWPKLCLAQLSGPDKSPILIDTVAPGLSLDPLFELLANRKVIKVFHAARQDVEIFFNLTGTIPEPLFDTQVAAAVCGHGEAAGYDALAAKLAGAQIDKSHRFTDWSRRPLSDKQLDYAAADVTYLVDVYLTLRDDLAARGRTDWMASDMAVLTSPATYDLNPEDAWRRVKSRVRKARDMAVLMDLAAWREREAQTRDVPRNRVIKDDAINDLAMNKPDSTDAMGQLRSIPRGYERSESGAAILEIIRGVLSRPKSDLPQMERHERREQPPGALIDLLKALLKHVAEETGVASRIIATSSDIDAIAVSDTADVPALSGWRRDIFGQQALKLKRGELAFAFVDGRLRLEERASSD